MAHEAGTHCLQLARAAAAVGVSKVSLCVLPVVRRNEVVRVGILACKQGLQVP
jgi:hypothetical protein